MFSNEAVKAYGEQVGRKYIQRINIIKESKGIDELKSIRALRCHPLKGDREGEWSITLTGFYRLIFTLHGEKSLPAGRQVEVAKIEEVSKHYDD